MRLRRRDTAETKYHMFVQSSNKRKRLSFLPWVSLLVFLEFFLCLINTNQSLIHLQDQSSPGFATGGRAAGVKCLHSQQYRRQCTFVRLFCRGDNRTIRPPPRSAAPHRVNRNPVERKVCAKRHEGEEQLQGSTSHTDTDMRSTHSDCPEVSRIIQPVDHSRVQAQVVVLAKVPVQL